MGSSAILIVGGGTYAWTYELTKEYRKVYSLETPMSELLANPTTKEIIQRRFPWLERIPFSGEMGTLGELLNSPFARVASQEIEDLIAELYEVRD